MSLPKRQLLDYQKFLEYVASGKATAVDLVIRDTRGGILFIKRIEKPLGFSLPGSVRLLNEPDKTVINWVGRKELGIDFLTLSLMT